MLALSTYPSPVPAAHRVEHVRRRARGRQPRSPRQEAHDPAEPPRRPEPPFFSTSLPSLRRRLPGEQVRPRLLEAGPQVRHVPLEARRSLEPREWVPELAVGGVGPHLPPAGDEVVGVVVAPEHLEGGRARERARGRKRRRGGRRGGARAALASAPVFRPLGGPDDVAQGLGGVPHRLEAEAEVLFFLSLFFVFSGGGGRRSGRRCRSLFIVFACGVCRIIAFA